MRSSIGLHLSMLALACACGDKPSEPEPAKRPDPPKQETASLAGSQTAGASTPEKKSTEITWDAPPGWALKEKSQEEPRRAGYAIAKVGADKEDAELLVLYFGTGKDSERDLQWNAWFDQLDGDPRKTAKRDAFKIDATGAEVETFEASGTYKLNVGKQRPGMKRSPVQMVKENFRMIGAVVKTPNKGNWFFRLVGPDETVQSSKDDFIAMLRSVR